MNLIDIRNERLKSLEGVRHKYLTNQFEENGGLLIDSPAKVWNSGAEAGYNEGWGALLDLVRPVLEKSVEGRKLLESL